MSRSPSSPLRSPPQSPGGGTELEDLLRIERRKNLRLADEVGRLKQALVNTVGMCALAFKNL